MIVVTVFLSILNQMVFHLVQNRKENCNHDHIPFNVKGNGNIVFSVWRIFQIEWKIASLCSVKHCRHEKSSSIRPAYSSISKFDAKKIPQTF